MACKRARKNTATNVVENTVIETAHVEIAPVETVEQTKTERLLFGVDSNVRANNLLQNNITEFEWASRNKLYPNFWGRNLVGDNALTKEEIDFLHDKGCKIAAIYTDLGEKQTEEQGQILAKKIDILALELGIPKGTAVFLEIGENESASRDFMRGFASMLMSEGFTPGFKCNTDAAFDFDHEYSRGMQTDKGIFEKCLIWAVSPSLAEFDRVTTTHLIHPDNWMPFAPSGITRQDIGIWQYGKNCHPIADNSGKETTFNVNLVRDEKIIIEMMF